MGTERLLQKGRKDKLQERKKKSFKDEETLEADIKNYSYSFKILNII